MPAGSAKKDDASPKFRKTQQFGAIFSGLLDRMLAER